MSNSIVLSLLSSFGDAKSKVNEGVSKVDPGSSTPGSGDLYSDVQRILGYVFMVVGIVAVIMIIYGGVLMLISMGDPGKNKKARDTIIYGIIGLIIVLLSWAIVNFVLSLFN